MDRQERDSQRLQDILDAIAAIERRLPRDKDDFLRDELLIVWMAFHVQTIGEASTRLSLEFRNTHVSQPWPRIIGMRNVIVHNYSQVDPNEVWNVVSRDILYLKDFVLAALAGMKPSADTP